MVRAVWSTGLVPALDEARMIIAVGEAVTVEGMPLLLIAAIWKNARTEKQNSH